MFRPSLLIATLTVTLAASGMGGCTSAPPKTPATASSTVAVAPHRYAATFEAAVEALRHAGFRIDRSDFRFGVLTTRPQGSPTLFEPWKPDNTTSHKALHSTLNDLRRTVTVTFMPLFKNTKPAKPANPLAPLASRNTRDAHATARLMAIEVQLESHQIPGRRLNGRVRGAVFSDRNVEPRNPTEQDVSNTYWQPLGRDPELETELQRRILSRLANPS